MKRIPMHSGDEMDAFSRSARRVLRSRPGKWRSAKRSYARRFRKVAAADARRQAVA